MPSKLSQSLVLPKKKRKNLSSRRTQWSNWVRKFARKSGISSQLAATHCRKTGQGALGEKGQEALSYPLMLRTSMCRTFAMEGKEGGEHPGCMNTHNLLQVFIPQVNIKSQFHSNSLGCRLPRGIVCFHLRDISTKYKLHTKDERRRRLIHLCEPEKRIFYLFKITQ